MLKALKYEFDKLETCKLSEYNPNKLNLGNQMGVFTGSEIYDNYTGPLKIGINRPSDIISIIPSSVHINTINDKYDEVYVIQTVSSSSTTCILLLFIFNKETSEYSYRGGLNLTFGGSQVYNVRNFEVLSNYYSEGTIECSGTSLTGTGTTWVDDRLCAGSRIGFGSTDPNQITEWFEISSIDSNTGITLTSDAGTITSGTPYVIHDLRVIFSISSVTLGGIFMIKGLRPELFNNSQPIIELATTIDNQRAVYISRHTLVNFSIAMDVRESWQTQKIYSIQAGPKIVVYNSRAALNNLSGGIDNTSLFEFETGNQAVTGTLNYNDNGVVGTLNHGDISGIKSFFFITTTRIYQCDLSGITNGSTTWQSRQMVELQPTGLVDDLRTLSNFTTINILEDLDRLILSNSTKTSIFKFIVDEPFELTFMSDDRQLDEFTSDSESFPHPAPVGFQSTYEYSNGFLHTMRLATTTTNTQLYVIPISSTEIFAFDKEDYVITPKFDITNFYKIHQITPNFVQKVGSDIFSIPNEAFKIFYRTSGISDNSGSWIELNQMGDLSSVDTTTTSEIQFAIVFTTLGNFCIPPMIKSLFLVYEDNSSIDGYDPDITKSSLQNREFVWIQTGFFNGNLPDLKITLTDVSNDTVIITDDTISPSGVWEYSEDNGQTWVSWDSTKNLLFNLIKYTNTSSLLDNKKVKTKLQLL
jgi:hypothetical protein